jgi:cell division protein FtsQ
MVVTAPADKRFRRAHLKPSRKRSGWQDWRWRGALAAIVMGLSFYTARRTVGVVVALEMFQVDQIVVHGNERLSTGEVMALVGGMSGQSILSVNLEHWRAALVKSPWVEEAALRRRLPSTVEVSVEERAPLGIGRISGVLYLVDDRGTVIDEYGPMYADLDLPIIDGLSAAGPDAASNVYRAALARRLLDSLRVRSMLGQISQIDVSDARNAVVLLEGDPTLLRLGNERFVERLQSYFELAPALRERVPAIDYVDLRFDERIYVRPAAEAGTRGVKPARAKRGKGTRTG